jgi:hypothetical protein
MIYFSVLYCILKITAQDKSEHIQSSEHPYFKSCAYRVITRICCVLSSIIALIFLIVTHKLSKIDGKNYCFDNNLAKLVVYLHFLLYLLIPGLIFNNIIINGVLTVIYIVLCGLIHSSCYAFNVHISIFVLHFISILMLCIISFFSINMLQSIKYKKIFEIIISCLAVVFFICSVLFVIISKPPQKANHITK